MAIPSFTDNHGLDSSDPETPRGNRKAVRPPPDTFDGELVGDGEDFDLQISGADAKSDGDLMALVAKAESAANSFMRATVSSAWSRSYKAYRNEHFSGSKYLSAQYFSRSKLFRPKTRASVRKNMMTAANALFATSDVVNISAQDESNDQQRASAAIKKELLNYRLNRTAMSSGVPWFLIAMGANQDAQIAGICVSKQYWKYQERTVTVRQATQTDPQTGKMVEEKRTQTHVVLDRPEIELYPPENVLIDSMAQWTRPSQSASYVILRNPMHVDDVISMKKANEGTVVPWDRITITEIRSAATSTPTDTMAAKRAREGGSDATDEANNAAGSQKPVWVYENFFRIDGEDWVWWSLGANKVCSTPVLVRDAYPEQSGERPICMGFGALEAHRIYPMSPVESWQQLQQEGNDIANLRLDQMKQVVTPVAKVIRGKQIDIAAVQRRGPNNVLLVSNKDDIEWDRPPDVPPSAYQEANYINNDFDELAGSFSPSSVQSNRQLNDTVGGMKLIAGQSSGITEFDLRVWVETWVEPVLYQLVKLISMYEDDATILAVAGNKAQLIEKFGINQITDTLLMQEATLMVNVGIGASDPMQKIAKIQAAADTVGKVLGPWIEAGLLQNKVRPNVKEIVNEVFGAAGFQDGGDRFFIIAEENPEQAKQEMAQPQPQQPPDPATAKAKIDQQTKQMEIAAKAQMAEKEQQSKGYLAKLKAITELSKGQQEHESAMALQTREQAHEMAHEHAAKSHDAREGLAAREFDLLKQVAKAQADQELQTMKAGSAEKQAKMKASTPKSKPKAK